MTERIRVRVNRVKIEALEVKSFELVSCDGTPLPAFTPGAHIDVHVPSAFVRQYSLCGDTDDRSRYLIAVKEEPSSRGSSRSMHKHVHAGDVLHISGPRNNFALADDARSHWLLAGGIGVTPLLSMARRLAASGADFAMDYFSRTPDHAAFREELSGPRFSERVSFLHALDPAAVEARLQDKLRMRPDGCHLYLCGPSPFMDLAVRVARQSWPSQAVHLEHFSAGPAQAEAPRVPFTIRLASSGAEYAVPADRSIVQVLREHGVPVDTSCEEGVCGVCMTRVLDGVPDHRDRCLTEAQRQAGDVMQLCVSRSFGGTLVLDI